MNLKKLSLRGQEGPWKDNQGKSAVFVSLSRSGLGISETAENSHVTPTPMPSQDNCCSIWMPFLPGLPRCGFLHREERTGTLPPAMRGDVMPPTPLPVLGSARVPRKWLAPLFSGLPWAPGPSWSLAYFYKAAGTTYSSTGCVQSSPETRGLSGRGRRASRPSKGVGALPPRGSECNARPPPSEQFTHAFTELVHQSVSKPSGDPEKGNTESLPIRNACSREGDKQPRR